MNLTPERMSEAEVALLLAEFLLALPGAANEVSVAIDGAGVKVGSAQVFPIAAFLEARTWQQTSQKGRNTWTGTYSRKGKTLQLHSRPGVGDVVINWRDRRVIAECKKGPLIQKKGSPERVHLAAALGQALLCKVGDRDLAVAAVPDSPAFRSLAEEWRNRPLFKKTGIAICLIARSGAVSGFPSDSPGGSP